MFDPENVLKIARISKAEGWPYPKTFQALVDAGVDSYVVEVATHQIIYHGNHQTAIEEKPKGFRELLVANDWNPQELKEALERNQVEKNYEVFLQDAAMAGVASYRVNMKKREITYLGKFRGQEYTEKIPAFTE